MIRPVNDQITDGAGLDALELPVDVALPQQQALRHRAVLMLQDGGHRQHPLAQPRLAYAHATGAVQLRGGERIRGGQTHRQLQIRVVDLVPRRDFPRTMDAPRTLYTHTPRFKKTPSHSSVSRRRFTHRVEKKTRIRLSRV